MQQEWDSLDTLIASSQKEVSTNDSYNHRLLQSLREGKSPLKRNLVSAFSLITAGLLLITIYTTDIRYRMIDLQLQIRYELTILENRINTNNNMFGE